MEIKYTTDNKKVVVIGSLNSQEKIVQEIFISNGSEVPSGEHFVVKSLHDSPVKSWKEGYIEKTEKEYTNHLGKLKKEHDREAQEYRDSISKLKALTNYNKLVQSNLDNRVVENVQNILEGKIRYVVVNNYLPEIIKFEELKLTYERGELKLLSLFGRDDGSMTFKLHNYPDGSGGGGYTEIFPFCDYESAFEKFKELLSDMPINEKVIDLAKEHKVILSKEKLTEFIEKSVMDIQNKIMTSEVYIASEKERATKLRDIIR